MKEERKEGQKKKKIHRISIENKTPLDRKSKLNNKQTIKIKLIKVCE